MCPINAQFLHPIVSIDSTPRLIIKQWARFTRCCADSVKVHLFLHLPSLQTQPRLIVLLVSFRVTLAWTCLLSTESNAPVFPAPAAKAAVGQRSVLREWLGVRTARQLWDEAQEVDGADAWRGIIIAGTGRLPMGVLAQNLCSLHSMAQFLGELLFFPQALFYHLLPKHHSG